VIIYRNLNIKHNPILVYGDKIVDAILKVIL
jgi:hypothetical protein